MLWPSQFLFCQPLFLGINRVKENIFAPSGEKLLLLAGLFLLGLQQRRFGDREHGTHGSLQPLKWGFGGRHAQHNTTSLLGRLQ